MPDSLRLFALLSGLLLSLTAPLTASAAYLDPPGRVARLDHTQGDVSYSPAGENEWVSVVRNRPLIRGDRLWTDRGARAEFQVGSTAIRLDSNTSVEILDLSDSIAQIQLSQGTLDLRVRRLYSGQSFEVATPSLAFTINRAGRYRIDVDPRNEVTTIVVWEGAGEAYGEHSSFPLRSGDTVRFYGSDLRDYQMYGLPREDDFDRYSRERDLRLDRSVSLRYLDDDVIGYEDLDEYGSWRPVSSYGNVWFPSRVDADWAPYREGHWVWQEPWGWTWVDDAPWGFAPSHYGRWVYVSNHWGWIPGPRNARPVYAPALVAFVGGQGWSISISLGDSSPIGWFPLGPREVYVPSYHASQDYFRRVNVNNTVINNTVINNVYNNYSTGTINVNQVNYVNRTVTGAVTAVPRTVFVNAQPVRRAAIRLDRNAVTTGEITRAAPIAPSVRSVIGAGTVVKARPSREAIDRQVFVRNAPPADQRPFAAREQQLQKNPGLAPEPSTVTSVQSRDDKTARNVRVIGEQRGAVNAREVGSRRGAGKPGTPSVAPSELQPLDRSVAPANGSESGTGAQQKAERQRQIDSQQQEQRQRKADSEQKTADQQKAERQRKADSDQKATDQQQAERQRQVDIQQQEQRQRKADSEQRAADQQKAERQRKADSDQKAADQQQAERQRQADIQQQEQRQRKADSEQRAADQQQAERQRKADKDQKTADQQQAERQRQIDTQTQEQRKRKADSRPQDKAAMQKQEAQRKAECEREAIRLHQDVRQCLPQEVPDNPNVDKNRK